MIRRMLLGGLLAVMMGCVSSQSGRETAFSPAVGGTSDVVSTRPLKLVLAVNEVYCRKTACSCVRAAERQYEDFAKALRKRYGIILQLEYYTEPYDLVQDFKRGRFDGAICKPWGLLDATRNTKRNVVRVADLQDPHKNSGLWGVMLVLKDSRLQTWRDLEGCRMALGDADGYEKHHAVLRWMDSHHVSIPATKRTEKAGCLECLDLLMKGEVDVAVISNYALTADCGVDVAKPEDFRILAETERIPLTSLMLDLNRVSPNDAMRLRQALLEISANALPESMAGGGFVAPAPWAPPELASLPVNGK